MIEARAAAGFAAQGLAAHLGLRLVSAHDGRCVIEVDFAPELTQHHGQFHGGVIATIADNACGFAAATLLPEGRSVVSVEFKTSFMRPAVGRVLRAEARVLKPGRSISFVQADVTVQGDGAPVQVAVMLATMMAVG